MEGVEEKEKRRIIKACRGGEDGREERDTGIMNETITTTRESRGCQAIPVSSSGQATTFAAASCWQSCDFSFPVASFLLRVFFFLKSKLQTLTPISHDHHPISGLGPSGWT
jgi:hypothetical protein